MKLATMTRSFNDPWDHTDLYCVINQMDELLGWLLNNVEYEKSHKELVCGVDGQKVKMSEVGGLG